MNLKIDHLKSAMKFISNPQICPSFCVLHEPQNNRTNQSLERNHLFKRFQKYNLCDKLYSNIQNITWHAEKSSWRTSVKHTDLERRPQEGSREDRLEPVSAVWPRCVVRPAVYSLLDSPTSWQTDGRSSALKTFFTKHPNCASLVSTHDTKSTFFKFVERNKGKVRLTFLCWRPWNLPSACLNSSACASAERQTDVLHQTDTGVIRFNVILKR